MGGGGQVDFKSFWKEGGVAPALTETGGSSHLVWCHLHSRGVKTHEDSLMFRLLNYVPSDSMLSGPPLMGACNEHSL